MKRLVDTQIVSLAFKDKDEEANELVQSSFISSITAAEFLLAQGKSTEKPDYYALPAKRYSQLANDESSFDNERWGNKKWARSGHKKTDQFILDFGGDFPLYVEYGSQAMSTIINRGDMKLYRFCVSHLAKKKQKYLAKRCEYLSAIKCRCLPLTKPVGELALRAMDEFSTKYSPKASPRNTVNDILILATARSQKLELTTRDNLLNRFAAEFLGGAVEKKSRWLSIDFSHDSTKVRRRSAESKGYINRGWHVRLLKGQV